MFITKPKSLQKSCYCLKWCKYLHINFKLKNANTMQNPFDNLDNRLSSIEKVLIKLDDRLIDQTTNIGTESKPDRYITTKEVAEIYGVSEVSVWDWEQKGFIIGYRIANTKRYKLSEILTAPKLIIRKKK